MIPLIRFSIPLLLTLNVALGAQTGTNRDYPRSGWGWSNLLTRSIASVPMVPSGYVADDIYKLRKGDKVSFQIIEDREQKISLLVTDSGELDIPYLGRVSAEIKTCKKLADELKTLLEKEYYFRATVIISLDEANKILGQVYVWGQVRTQGAIDLRVNETLTVGKAILRAGGFGDFANKKKIKLIRNPSANQGEKRIFELNMAEILADGKMEKDVQLQPDDFIIVPARLVNF